MSDTVTITKNRIEFVLPDPTDTKFLTESRILFSIGSPLVVHQLFNCDLKWVDEGIPTAGATYSKNTPVIIINRKFFRGLSNSKQRAFVLMHECAHIYLHHLGRQTDMGYNPQLWNIAADFYINPMVTGWYIDSKGDKHQCSKYKSHFELIPGVLFREDFIGLSADEIYQKLLEENDNSAEKAVEKYGGGAGEGFGESEFGMPLDEISAEKVSAETRASTNRTSARAVAAASVGGREMGDADASLAQTYSDIFKPKVNWKDEFPEMVRAALKERYTYNRLSRRHSGDVFFPSMIGEKIQIVAGIDTSGSMGVEEITEGLTEIKGIIDQYEGWSLDLISCDTKPHLIGVYASEDGDDFASIDKNLIGGGGTDMAPLAKYAADKWRDGEEVNACVIFTDGYIPVDSIAAELVSDIQTIIVVSSTGNRQLNVPGAKMLYMADIG